MWGLTPSQDVEPSRVPAQTSTSAASKRLASPGHDMRSVDMPWIWIVDDIYDDIYYLLIDIIGCVLEKSVRFGCTLHLQYF